MAGDAQSRNSVVKSVLDAVADWVRRYHSALKRNNELAGIGANEVAAIAKDLGISATQLRELASKGARASQPLRKLLVALDVDPKELEKIDARVARDMQWLCVTCSKKAQCNHDLSTGVAAETFRKICPNAMALDAIFNLRVKDISKTTKGPLKHY
ncbi:MAG TPA: hypothetical protein VEJ43_17140 [Pseudolabrys sp.]|nr:hypothetical protein [Pseudolabrys sp.]